MTEGIGWKANGGDDMKMDFIDIRRAYFHAAAIRDVYVELPAEDYEEGMCGKLEKSMYGTRDAAQNWEKAYNEFMESIGFTVGTAGPCVFMNKKKNLKVVVHGDDLTIPGNEEDLNWLHKKYNK